MRTSDGVCILSSAVTLIVLSVFGILINYFYYQYPGNNYFPPNTPMIAISLLLMYGGFSLQFGYASRPARLLKEVVYFFLVMVILAFATNAAQYTPFPLIDKQLVIYESTFGINLEAIIAWSHSMPVFKKLLALIYDSLPLQMSYIPLLVIAANRINLIREYYFLLLFSALIGFTFYYFFPTAAPASVIDSPYFSMAQKATGLKFHQIHHYIKPTTLEGGMIALPSFHVIWAWFCLYLLRGWPLAFAIMLPINILLVASCVLLGWHYPVDLLGSLIVIIAAHGFYHIAHCHKIIL